MEEVNLNDEIYMALVDSAEDYNDDDLSQFRKDKSNCEIAEAICNMLEKRGYVLMQKNWNYENKIYLKR
jgi:hypothetical protein